MLKNTIFLIQKENGFTYDFGDTAKLKECLATLINNPKLRASMGKANITRAKDFLWSKIAKQLESLYQALSKKD